MSNAKPQGAMTTRAAAPPSTGLAQMQVGATGALEVRTAGDLMELCLRIAGTEIVPPDVRGKPDACFAKATLGMSLGFDAMTSIRRIEMWSGKPTLPAELMLAAIRNKAQGVLEHMEIGYEGKPFDDDFHAWIETRRRGFTTVRSTFSVADAKQAELWGKKDNWRKYPKAMLKWRAVGIHAREAWSDVMNGVQPSEDYDREDFRGPDRARNVTQAGRALELDLEAPADDEGDPLLEDARPALEPEIVGGEGAAPGEATGVGTREPEPEGPAAAPSTDTAPASTGPTDEWGNPLEAPAAAAAPELSLEHEAKLAELREAIKARASEQNVTQGQVSRDLARLLGIKENARPTIEEANKMLKALTEKPGRKRKGKS